MGFLDSLRRVVTGQHRVPAMDPQPAPGPPGIPPGTDDTTPGPDVYDRVQWHKKLKRILAELPASQPGWAALMTEARAHGFEPAWVRDCQLAEFRLLVRRAVADRHVTEDEHRKLDLARDLIGIPEAEAESILHAIIAEAESFFGEAVQDD